MLLTANSLQPFISAKSCRLYEVYILEAKFGKANFNFSSIEADKVEITLQKISGNGKICINSNNQALLYTILSNKGQVIELDLEEVKNFEISRPADSIGEVGIVSVLTVIMKWKKIIKQCGEYSSLKMVGDQLFASEGGCFHNNDLIETIETLPPDVYIRAAGQIKFLTSCEIVNLVPSSNVSKSSVQLYSHQEAPTVISPAPPSPLAPAVMIPKVQQVSRPINNAVYDSLAVREFNKVKFAQSTSIKFIKSNAIDYLLLKRGGIFNIPIPIVANTEYEVIVTAKKLSGNGKLKINFITSKPIYVDSNVLIGDQMADCYISLNSGTSNENYSLNLNMGEHSTGEILISRIQVSKKSHIYIEGTTSPIYEYAPIEAEYDLYLENSEKFAILPPQKFSAETFPLEGVVQTTCLGAAQWLAKVLPLFPNIAIHKNSLNLLNRTRFDQKPDVLIGKLGHLQYCDRIWLEEFQGKAPSPQDLLYLNAADVIMNPSVPNLQFLRELLPGKKIIHLPRLWTLLNSEPIKEKYCLYFEKSPKLTEILIKSWAGNFPQLFVVGTRLTLPTNMTAVSTYAPYSEINRLISNADVLIDLSPCNLYNSGILDLAHSLGVKIVTNNLWLNLSKPKPEYVPSRIVGINSILPHENQLNEAIGRMLSLPFRRNNIENYNLNVEATLREMMGK